MKRFNLHHWLLTLSALGMSWICSGSTTAFGQDIPTRVAKPRTLPQFAQKGIPPKGKPAYTPSVGGGTAPKSGQKSPATQGGGHNPIGVFTVPVAPTQPQGARRDPNSRPGGGHPPRGMKDPYKPLFPKRPAPTPVVPKTPKPSTPQIGTPWTWGGPQPEPPTRGMRFVPQRPPSGPTFVAPRNPAPSNPSPPVVTGYGPRPVPPSPAPSNPIPRRPAAAPSNPVPSNPVAAVTPARPPANPLPVANPHVDDEVGGARAPLTNPTAPTNSSPDDTVQTASLALIAETAEDAQDLLEESFNDFKEALPWELTHDGNLLNPNDSSHQAIVSTLEYADFSAEQIDQFFDLLESGDFEEAAAYLRGHGIEPNPDVNDPDDGADQIMAGYIRMAETQALLRKMEELVEDGGTAEEIRTIADRIDQLNDERIDIWGPHMADPNWTAEHRAAGERMEQMIEDLATVAEARDDLEAAMPDEGGDGSGGSGGGDSDPSDQPSDGEGEASGGESAGPEGAAGNPEGGAGGPAGGAGGPVVPPGGGFGPGGFLPDPGCFDCPPPIFTPGDGPIVSVPYVPQGTTYWVPGGTWITGCGCQDQVSIYGGTPAYVGVPVPSVEPIPDASAGVCAVCLEGRIVVINPADATTAVSYVVGDVTYNMEPGYIQDMSQASLVVRFDRGGSFGEARYTLKSGKSYKFIDTANGKDLVSTTFVATLDNTANEQEFQVLVGDDLIKVPARQTQQVTSAYPIVASFDDGQGNQVRKSLEMGKTYTIGIDADRRAWNLFPGNAEESGAGRADEARQIASADISEPAEEEASSGGSSGDAEPTPAAPEEPERNEQPEVSEPRPIG